MQRAAVIVVLAVLLGSCGQVARPVTVHAADAPPPVATATEVAAATEVVVAIEDHVAWYVDFNSEIQFLAHFFQQNLALPCRDHFCLGLF